jgi:hypothetical protein
VTIAGELFCNPPYLNLLPSLSDAELPSAARIRNPIGQPKPWSKIFEPDPLQKDVGNGLIRDLRAQMLRSVDNSSLPTADKHYLALWEHLDALSERSRWLRAHQTSSSEDGGDVAARRSSHWRQVCRICGLTNGTLKQGLKPRADSRLAKRISKGRWRRGVAVPRRS